VRAARGPPGAQALNAFIGAELDPAQAGEGWYRGRLVLVTENSYRQQLFNGDIGIAWPDEHDEMRVWFDGEGGRGRGCRRRCRRTSPRSR
jgi:exodeoxyribonuclease V alpha subunit